MNSLLLRRILVVDDEPNIVSSVRRELTTHPLGRFHHEVEGYADPAEALDRARSQAFDVVISDYRMPAMTGVEFLKRLTVIQPECVRIVLSGQTDMDALAAMINETHIYRFIPKPWNEYSLKSSVAQALEFKSAVQENKRLAGLVKGHDIALAQPDQAALEHILIVDDDTDVLKSLSRSLTNHSMVHNLFSAIRAELTHRKDESLNERNIRVQSAWSPQQAIELAAATEFSCVLADQRMPGMSGVELLTLFAEKQPDCARILFSGAIKQADLIDAVDAAHIFGFIAKPWQDYELKSCVAQALGYRHINRENRILAEIIRKAAASSGPGQ